jgi:UV DNA damage endonuclease
MGLPIFTDIILQNSSIRFMRMASEMFPFASHATHSYDLSYCQEELKAVGDLAKKYGHRLTTYPGPLTQLASPKENVVEASIKDLECQCSRVHLVLHRHIEPLQITPK